MKIQADAYFALGKTHTICQDYATVLQESDDVASIALSDGCSSSPHTDFGARFITRAAVTNPAPFSLPEALQVASDARQSLALPLACLDATLLMASVEKKMVTIRAFGDGVLVLQRKDGSSMTWELSSPGNAPPYPNYLLNEGRLKRYLTEHKFLDIATTMVADGKVETTRTQVELGVSNFGMNLSFPTDELSGVFLCSDGVQSFRRKTPEGTFVPVSLQEVLAQITAVKSCKGEFMVRRMRKFLYEFCPKNGWTHDDDVSVAALLLAEDGQ